MCQVSSGHPVDEKYWPNLRLHHDVLEATQALLDSSILGDGRSRKGPPPTAVSHKMKVPTDGHRPLKFSINFRSSPATYHAFNSGPLRSPNTPIPLFCRLLSAWRVLQPSLAMYPILGAYFKTTTRLPCCSLVLAAPVLWFRTQSLDRFWKLWTIDSIDCLSLSRWCCYKMLNIFMTPKNKLWALPNTRKLHERKPERVTGSLSRIRGYLWQLWWIWM